MANKVILDQKRLYTPMDSKIITEQTMYELFIPANTLASNSRLRITTTLGRVFDLGELCPDTVPECGCVVCSDYGHIASVTYNGSSEPGGFTLGGLASNTPEDYTGVVFLYVPAQEKIGIFTFNHEPLGDGDIGSTWFDTIVYTLNPGDVLSVRTGYGNTTSYRIWVNNQYIPYPGFEIAGYADNWCTEFVTFPVTEEL